MEKLYLLSKMHTGDGFPLRLIAVLCLGVILHDLHREPLR